MSVPVLAQPAGSAAYEIGKQLGAAAGTKGANMGDPVDPRYIAVFIIKTILTIVGTLMFGFMVYAGYTWMTAGGNDEKVLSAKTTIRNSIIGLIIVLSAYAITIAVTNIAGGRPVDSGMSDGSDPLESAMQGCADNLSWGCLWSDD